jgi:hypothetical protein
MRQPYLCRSDRQFLGRLDVSCEWVVVSADGRTEVGLASSLRQALLLADSCIARGKTIQSVSRRKPGGIVIRPAQIDRLVRAINADLTTAPDPRLRSTGD